MSAYDHIEARSQRRSFLSVLSSPWIYTETDISVRILIEQVRERRFVSLVMRPVRILSA